MLEAERWGAAEGRQCVLTSFGPTYIKKMKWNPLLEDWLQLEYLFNPTRSGCLVSRESYQDTVLINICFLDNMRSLFWQEFIEYEISIIKILKPAIFCFLQYFLQNGINCAAFITQ